MSPARPALPGLVVFVGEPRVFVPGRVLCTVVQPHPTGFVVGVDHSCADDRLSRFIVLLPVFTSRVLRQLN